MRLLIFTNRDLAGNIMLNLLLPTLCKTHKIHIFVSDAVGGKNTNLPPEPLRQLKFFEQQLPNEILFPALEQSDRPVGAYYLTFKELSRLYEVPMESLNEIKSPETLAHLQALQPDLVLSVRYGKIFGSALLQIPRLGVINLHSGLLPAYRGVLATFRALNNGDQEIGCTLHYIEDSSIDTGGIIGFSTIAAQPERSLLWHILSLYPAAAALVLSTIERISDGEKLNIQPQSAAGAAYYTFPTEAEISVFLNKGWKMVDDTDLLACYKQFLGP